MLVSLPLAGYVLFFCVCCARGQGWRDATILAATLWGVFVVLITELLSLQGWLAKSGLVWAWCAIDIAALIYLWQPVRQRVYRHGVMRLRPALYQGGLRIGGANLGLLRGVSVIVAVIGLVALLSPPNTGDVMIYHMPRVMHWIQNHSIGLYPTHDLRQLHMPPWAEFAIFHLHVLTGNDSLINLVQWFSMLASVIGVTLLAQSLGAGHRGQVLAAVICATIPQGVLQASGAKNDYVVAFWLLALTYYLLKFKREPTLVYALGMGAALGLAWLTKGTAYIFSVAILTAWGLAWLWNVRTGLQFLVLAAVVVIGLNTGHFARNYRLYGSPLGPGAEGPPAAFKYTNDKITPSTLVSNVLRNVAIHLGTRSAAANAALERWVAMVVHTLGGDVNDPKTTWDFTSFHVPEASYNEDLAGNPIHLVLIVLALVMMAGWGLLRKSRELVVYMLGLALAFTLFCTLLRWQPWNTRLHLPLFVLSSAAIGVVLEHIWPRPATNTLGVLLLLLSVPVLLNNQLRPLALGKEFSILQRDRVSLYFAGQRDLLDSYRAAVGFVKGGVCPRIGLDLPGNSYEYPFLKLLGTEQGDKTVRAVGVTNASAVYAGDESHFQPCAIICLGCSNATEKWRAYSTKIGPATIFDPIVVFGGGRISESSGT
jgi:4-amino-4-deoxy-L-arabinose transferase-like glycosyltransferase